MVRSVALSRGQDILIASQLEELVLATNMVKIVEHDKRGCNMGSILQLSSKEDILEYLDELRYCLSNTDCYVHAHCILAQKV
ncbi:hypothetical protein RO3G_03001 [Rhizopus delemar RA 99-880]|uniref:Uncharacterized protein n=1 Tax=Rhizopus delemar (strain RA 99-880 / ATCC MYA-4621 / FGSC 9543 / NRRL 43880) TaxID=246409 RepID=I1BQ17_RHIO9|nr:hypothetical protein RO3G_03001 [Rhizopus delemar RA 99-880]|eukprot:EIE78297.1 hypothetical protein RO3G_03001 [Rhizopus delemar RA 99-880]